MKSGRFENVQETDANTTIYTTLNSLQLVFRLTECTIKVENELFNWKLRMFFHSENCSQPWPIRQHEITFILKRETVLSIHQ